jgi:hypothetical protein
VESAWFVLEIEFALDKECPKLPRFGTIKRIWFPNLGFGVFGHGVLSGIACEVIDSLRQTKENSVLSIKSFFIIIIIIIRIIMRISPWGISIIIRWSSTGTNSCVIWIRNFRMFYGRGS